MEQNELDVRNALAALVLRQRQAYEALGKSVADDPLLVAAEKALGAPGGLSANNRHLMLSLGEVARCLSALSEVAIQGINDDSVGRLGNPIAGLEKTTQRLLNISSGKAFDWSAFEATKESKSGIGKTPKTTE
jgi:hypothetical protein